MISLKKAALAVFAFGVSSAASAGMYEAPPAAMGCTGNNVTVPCEKRGWSFAADALYVETNNVGPVTATVSGGETSTNRSFNDFQSDWQWGFELAAAYYFGTGNDINLNWTHFTSNSSETNTQAGVVGLYTVSFIDDIGEANSISTSVDNNFDAVNFEFGQLVHFGEHVDTRFHAGLQYASISQTLDQSAWISTEPEFVNTGNIKSEFNGLGPRLGMDNSYNFGNGVSLFGNLEVGLLVGDITTNLTFTEIDSDVPGGEVQATYDNSFDSSLVPEAEAKLGVSYTKPLAQGDLSVDVGYEVANYWDALASTTDYNETTNFGYNGLFFGLKWMGNA